MVAPPCQTASQSGRVVPLPLQRAIQLRLLLQRRRLVFRFMSISRPCRLILKNLKLMVLTLPAARSTLILNSASSEQQSSRPHTVRGTVAGRLVTEFKVFCFLQSTRAHFGNESSASACPSCFCSGTQFVLAAVQVASAPSITRPRPRAFPGTTQSVPSAITINR